MTYGQENRCRQCRSQEGMEYGNADHAGVKGGGRSRRRCAALRSLPPGKYTGCISCFGCKKERFKGHCICRDGLTPVLDAIREADGLIIGSPNYLGEMTASFRALYERLIFQNLTYNVETPCCNDRMIPVLLIMTSNAPDTYYAQLLENYRQTLSRFVGPARVLVSGNTLQLKDYGKTDWEWTLFDPEDKRIRHETVFPQECKKAFEMGKELAGE